MPAAPFQVRPARDDDRRPLAELFAAVAEERDGIATEPPVDLESPGGELGARVDLRRDRR